TNGIPDGQYGLVDNSTLNTGLGNNATNTWQQDLSTNTNIRNNYNLPGAAYGSLVTNSFDLSSYTSTDKPTLYFNYLLNTEQAASTPNVNTLFDDMRDS